MPCTWVSFYSGSEEVCVWEKKVQKGELTADLQRGEGLKPPEALTPECHGERIRAAVQGETTLFLNLLPWSAARRAGGRGR